MKLSHSSIIYLHIFNKKGYWHWYLVGLQCVIIVTVLLWCLFRVKKTILFIYIFSTAHGWLLCLLIFQMQAVHCKSESPWSTCTAIFQRISLSGKYHKVYFSFYVWNKLDKKKIWNQITHKASTIPVVVVWCNSLSSICKTNPQIDFFFL